MRLMGFLGMYKDGPKLHLADGQYLLLPSDGSLFFLSTSEEDTADYYCAVHVMKGLSRSRSAKLSVVQNKEDISSLSEKIMINKFNFLIYLSLEM